ncbi:MULTISPECIES: helix-turn-helix transcriptional regulator [unclassified Janthinobacterium]|uniref:helix-turn-helix transcriptional regulator n=1 Tax=unclassified Janthinobacterium TaxID=2610881 RepID=UPI0008F4D522|nr:MULTISPECIES: YafY family protein [unclassified Janthinobacterium]APA66525.1 DNA-binding protein [Janthinobacterium sp. 1_2014MBL_MicDiv]MDN2707823.1 YafY family protein [Janthinobacterium sp. SUN118]
MSRSGRLFLLMDAMRAKRVPVTAAQLAQQLGVSERTIYRDIQTLAELGAPLQGEAGIGYVLRRGVFLPPLMFGPDELEALVLGARWVRRQGDAGLAQAASAALAKIAAASPRDLRDNMAETSLWVPLGRPADGTEPADRYVQPVREAIRYEQKLTLGYQDERGSATQRTVWPFALAFFEGKRLLAAWCELRGDYRHFRIDRIASVDNCGERYPTRRHVLLETWRKAHDIDPET